MLPGPARALLRELLSEPKLLFFKKLVEFSVFCSVVSSVLWYHLWSADLDGVVCWCFFQFLLVIEVE